MSSDAPATRITVLPHAELCPDGLTFDAAPGNTLVDELLINGIQIEHACDRVCACATCHVHLREGGANVNPVDDDEDEQLSDAWGLAADSRLSCCVKVAGPELVVELPRYSKNQAKAK